MAFTIPDNDEAGNPNQAIWMQTDIDVLTYGFGYTGVGLPAHCAVIPKSPAEMKVHVNVGVGILRTVAFVVAPGDITVTTADSSYPRIDIVYLTLGTLYGSLNILGGAPSTNPKAPTYPANSVVLAFVYVPAGATSITANNITDKRIILVPEYQALCIPASSFVAYEGSPTLSVAAGYPVWLLDKDIDESIIAHILVPTNYRPGLSGSSFDMYVEHVQVGTATGTVRQEFQYKLGSNLGAAFTTVAADVVVDQGQHYLDQSGGPTITCTESDSGLVICIRRDANHANDNLDGDWGILGAILRCWVLV